MGDWFSDFSERGFAVIDGFLPDDICRALYEEQRLAFATGAFREGRVGRENPQLESAERRDYIRWLAFPETLEACRESDAGQKLSPALMAFACAVLELRGRLRAEAFLPLRGQEFHAAVYGAGGYYKRHVDTFRGLNQAILGGERRRLVSCVYYLSPDRTESDGGQLRLFPLQDPRDPNSAEAAAIDVLPQANRFVIFESHLAHEVLLNHKERYSITGWLKA